MNLVQQFEMLGRKQIAIQEGIDLLRRLQRELAQTRVAADVWGATAVLANVTLIPLNIIVNAVQVRAASSAYETLVALLYGKFGRSGARLEGHAKSVLALLKGTIVDELRRKGLTHFVPGVNILVGLAEDSMAAWQAIQLVGAGSREISMQMANLERQIAAASFELMHVGTKTAELLERLHPVTRTA